jgi:two-component system OmpR family response regulator
VEGDQCRGYFGFGASRRAVSGDAMTERTLKRIMYVDDEPDIRQVAKISLELVGKFELCLCSSGREALDKVQAFRPDLILLDVMMPGMDGSATLSALRDTEGATSIPVIFVTAKAQPAEIARYRSLGVLEVLKKPFQPMQLPDQLRELWRRCDQALAK